jgi:hypothetical protein
MADSTTRQDKWYDELLVDAFGPLVGSLQEGTKVAMADEVLDYLLGALRGALLPSDATEEDKMSELIANVRLAKRSHSDSARSS